MACRRAPRGAKRRSRRVRRLAATRTPDDRRRKYRPPGRRGRFVALGRRGARDGVRRAVRRQRLAHAQRHDAVARAGALSGVPRPAVADLLPDRHHHLHLPAHRLAAAADHRLLRSTGGPAPYALPAAMGFSLIGLAALAYRRQLSGAARLRRADRRRQRGLSSRSLARRARRLRRTLRPGAEPVPGRRQFRPVARAADGGVHRRAVRPAFGARLHRARLYRRSCC